MYFLGAPEYVPGLGVGRENHGWNEPCTAKVLRLSQNHAEEFIGHYVLQTKNSNLD